MVQLFGGPWDGERMPIPDHVLREGLRMDSSPSISLAHAAENPELAPGYVITVYRWDNTITDTGEYRMRASAS